MDDLCTHSTSPAGSVNPERRTRSLVTQLVLRPPAAWVRHRLEAFLLWPLAASKRLADKCRLALLVFHGQAIAIHT